MKKPYIGVNLDHEPAGGYSDFPWYALRQNYFDAIEHAGGIPVGLTYQFDLIESYLDLIQGLLVPGGFFDIHPSQFGEDEVHETVVTKDRRTRFDLGMTKGALERDIPFLGICAGEQLLNVVRGGSLIQHIPDTIPDALEHEQKTPRDQPTHSIEIVPGTLLHEIAGSTQAMVNSTHHQAVRHAGENLVINARAPDGVIEGIEDPSLRFCLGVEWHPEYESTDLDRRIFKRFIQEASTCR